MDWILLKIPYIDSVSAIFVHGIDQKGVTTVPPSAHSQTT